MTVEATTDAIPTQLSASAAEVTTTQVVTVQNAPAPGETEQPARPSLSPSRAADFKTCPLLYRFRSVDRLPERPSFDQLRGTLVHAVLERLFDLPAEDRTPERAAELVEPQWTRMLTEHEELVGLFAAGATDDAARNDAAPPPATEPGVGPAAGTGAGGAWEPDETGFMASARDLLGGYFAVEDPRRLEPAERECLVTTEVDDGRLVLRG